MTECCSNTTDPPSGFRHKLCMRLHYEVGSQCRDNHGFRLSPIHLSLQNGLAEAPVNKSRKQIKERKNRTKKIRGVKKNTGACIIDV